MNIYLISQSENNDYDTYDSAVVVAESEEEARDTHPSDGGMSYSMAEAYGSDSQKWSYDFSTWASHPKNVEVQLIGKASPDMEKGVVCASFNAG